MAGEAVLSKVLQELLSKLNSPILDEFGLLWGVKKEKQKLQSNLSRIKAVLQDAERQQLMDLMADRDRLGKLRDVAYDAEDLVDEFLFEALRRKVENQDGMGRKVGNFFSPSNPLAFHFKIAHKMKELRKRFEELAEENNNFQPLEGVARSQPQISTTRETYSSVPYSGVYGRDDEKGNLIDSLINSGNEEVLSVIPIVGMGGLGKTTLAQYVYDDGRVETHFNLKMWVYVSEDFDVGKILAKILQSATKSAPTDGSSMDLLNTFVKENLTGKRYLLVLDDVWNEESEKWDRLRTALQCGAKGSKVLVTTRSDTVARRMDALPRPPLGTLSPVESWTLFEKVAHPPTGFVSIGKEIVRKCGGVPLAIKTLGGMLRNETREREWQSVRDSELWKRTDNEGGILSILRLSYDHLTSSLKQCFAYCAVIPKGRRFNKDELIKKWIAQGFINSHDELLEEEGEKYFDALLRRSLFQVDEKTYGRKPYKMHDLIHDLLRSVAGKECFVVEASMMNDLTRHLALFNDETRHLASCNNDDLPWEEKLKNLYALKKCKKLRSMITYGYYCPIDINVCSSFFTCLRVLDLSSRSIHFLPNSIDKLRHLRYFDISDTGIKELPETICNLHSLQTLRILHIPLQKWPKNMKRMISLRHIEIGGRNNLPLPKGIGELTFLRTLPKSRFIIAKESEDRIEELKDLNLLWGNIHIGGLHNVGSVGCAGETDLKDLLKAKKHVNSLTLSWSVDETVAAEGNAEAVFEVLEPHSDLKELWVQSYTGLKFPSWFTEKLKNLKNLGLRFCTKCVQLPRLGQLESLTELWIRDCPGISSLPESMGDLKSLTQLWIHDCPGISSLPESMGDLKSLTQLWIHDCPGISSLPESMGELKSLTELWIRDCPGISSLPESMGELKSLTELWIRDCPGISSLPESMGELKSLTELWICDCPGISSLPESMGDLKSLTQLWIHDCPGISSLPESMGELKSLTELWIRDCPGISSLLESMGELKSLTKLLTEKCPGISSLPESMGDLKSLTQLCIHDCPGISSLPELIGELKSLTELWIRGCPGISSLPESMGDLTMLGKLMIERCPGITTLPNGLKRLGNLFHLQIDGCPDLKRKLRLPEGQDWHKVAHVKRILIDMVDPRVKEWRR